MASLKLLVTGVSPDVISTRNIRLIDETSVVNLWATCVTLTDEIGLNLGSITLMDPSLMNIKAAALSVVDTGMDQLIMDLIVGPDAGDLAIPVPTLNTSLIFLLSVEPLIA